MSRWIAPSSLALGALLAASACGVGGDASGPAPTGPVTIRAVMTHDPPSLSLLGKADLNSEILAAQITDSLVQFDGQMELRPRLAESWEMSDDFRTLTFKLRPGVRWHDGTPVTAEDVVFSVELIRDPVVENRSYGPELAKLTSVEALDPLTLRVRYAVPTPDYLGLWRLPILPRHLAERGAALLTGRYAEHPVGCGPFRFVRYLPGEELLLEANDDYWDGRPKIDRLLFKIWPDHRTAFQALLAGELDILNVVPELLQQALESDHGRPLDSFVFYRNAVWVVMWNLDGTNPFFIDPRVRRALVLALDRGRFIANLLHGLGRPAATSFHPDMPYTDPETRPLPFDPDQARRLLEEAGWRDTDGDGIRDRDGVPFSFTLLMYTSTQQINDHMAAWQQQSWGEIGVHAEIEKLELNQFRERRNNHAFQAAMGGMSFTPEPDQYDMYHSSAREGGFNFGGLADPEVDRLLELVRVTVDPQERRRSVIQLQRRLYELQPVAWLLHFPSPVLHDRRLRGVHPTPLDFWRISDGPRVWSWSDPPGQG